MTRINCGIDPCELPGVALLAEHREITRIPNVIRAGRARLDNLPTRFTMGIGHVRFFYDKLGYLLDRYCALRDECWRRGYQVQNKELAFTGVPLGAYLPTPADRKITLARLATRGHVLINLKETHNGP